MSDFGEPTTLLSLRHPGKRASAGNGSGRRDADRGTDRDAELSGAERRERAAIRRVGFWGAALSAAAVLLGSLLMGAMRGG